MKKTRSSETRLDPSHNSLQPMLSRLEKAPDMVLMTNRRGGIIYTNPKGVALLQLQPDWEPGISLFSFVPPGKARKTARESFRMIMSGDAEPWEWNQIEIVKSHGESLRLDWMPMVIRDGNGRADGIFATASESIALHQEKTERDSGVHLRSLIDNVPFPIWEEDYSEVKKRLDFLTETGISDFEAYFNSHPEEIRACARRVRVIHLNKAARDSSGISENDDSPDLESVFSTETYSVFKEQLLSMVRGATLFSGTSMSTAAKGTPKHYVINWMVMPGHETDYSRVFVSGIEVTDLKIAESALNQSEAKFSLAFRSSPDALSITSMADDHFIEVNESFLRITGYSREDVLGNTARQLKLWENKKEYLEFSRLMRESGGVRNFRAGFVRRNGDRITMSISSEPMVLEGEACLLSIARDVSQLEAAQRALKESEEKYRHLVENNPSFITHTSPKGEILFVNRAFPGFSNDQMLGANILDFLQEEFHDRIRAVFDQVAKNGITAGFEASSIDGSGNVVWLNTFVSPIYHDRKLDSLLLVSRDKTEARKTESALRESEREYRTLVEAATDAIFIVQDQVVRFCNSSLAEISGYPVEDIMGKSFIQFVHEKDRERIQQIHMLRQQGKSMPRSYEASLISRDRRRLDVEINVTDYSFQGRPAYLIIMRDITERRILEERMREAQKIEVVGQLAGGVAHDFNNLLTVISGYSQMIQADSSLDETLRQRVDLIRRAGDRAQSLTNQLLAFSRKQITKTETLDLNHLIRESMKMLSSLIRKEIRIELNLEEPIPGITADPHQIEQILINLVVNARDAIDEKGEENGDQRIVISTATVYLDRMYVATHPDAASGLAVAWAVSDTGTGMAHEVRSRIFEPFFTTKEMGRGTGLGLSSVYGIVKQNRADITVSSNPGEGSEFRIFWPANTDPGARFSGSHSSRYPGGEEKILLMEEDAGFRRFLSQELESIGYTVVEAVNGIEALELIRNDSCGIELMIADPETTVSCRRLLNQARELCPSLPIICSMGYSDDSGQLSALGLDNILLFQKPCSMLDLAHLIRIALENDRDG